MRPVSCGFLEDQGLVATDARAPPDRAHPIGRGLACSLVLHVLVALLFVFGLPGLVQAPPLVDEPIWVDLVQFGEASPSPGRQQVKPPDLPRPQPPKRDALAEVEPQPQEKPPDLPKPEPPKRDPRAEVEPPRTTPPVHDDIDILLNRAEKSHWQVAAPRSHQPRNGPAPSDRTATNDDAAVGQQGMRGVKDFLRAQIERHWEFDMRDLGAADPVISIHLELNADGSVRRADIVDDPRYSSDPRYRSLATSVRNAAILSSPLHLPPGTYDAFKDITLKFNPREALR
jgi:outer membrane biosynthesis protein TonB